MQLGEQPGAAGGEGGKRASSGFILIDLSQLQLTSFNKEMSSVSVVALFSSNRFVSWGLYSVQ